MNKNRILDVCRLLEAKSFIRVDSVRKQLLAVLYHLECAKYNTDLLRDLDFTRLRVEDTPSYSFGSSSTTIECTSCDDVAFHLKRLTSDIILALSHSLDKLWKCSLLIYNSNPSLNEVDGLPDKINSICLSTENLEFIQFVKDHFQEEDHNKYRRMVAKIRNLLAHDDYSIQNDIIILPGDAGWSNNIPDKVKLVFDRDEEFAIQIPQAKREYKIFFQDTIDILSNTGNAFLEAIESDLDSASEVPIEFTRLA